MDPERILVRGPNWVGDAVMAVPALKALRSRFTNSAITLMVRPWVAGLFKSAAYIDDVWIEPRPEGLRDWFRITRDIRRRRFDLGILLPNSFESALTMLLGRVPRRVGYAADGRRWLLTEAVARKNSHTHQVHYYLDLMKPLSVAVEQPSIEIDATDEARRSARNLLASEGIPRTSSFLVLNPGAAYGSAKRWYEERFATVADALARESALSVAIVGSTGERLIAEQIQSRMKTRSVILSGRTSLETLLGVLAESSLMITNDSGPMHIAAAVGTPLVAIFGPTDEHATGPYSGSFRIVKKQVQCSPCLLRECPIDHRCMQGVTADDVYAAARELMNPLT